MTPRLGDDVADLLDPHGTQLRRWMTQTRTTLRYAGWEDRGNTTARLIAVYASRNGARRKVIMKYVPKGHRETEEPGRHADAWECSPVVFRNHHLVRQVWDPIMLSEHAWIMFQEIAAQDLTKIRSMSTLLADGMTTPSSLAKVTEAVRVVVHAVLDEWHDEGPGERFSTAGEHLRELLGPRLRAKHPLLAWAYSRDLLTGPASAPIATGLDDLVNPFALVLDAHPASEQVLYVPYGRTHGDFHPGNILLGPEPDQFWFIDLSRFSPDSPLTFDPVCLLLTTTAHFLPHMTDDAMRSAAIELLLDPGESRNSWLPGPYRDLVTAIHDTAESWANELSLAQEWRTATLLSIVAGSLMMCGRKIVADADREWFLRLAASAASRYVESAGAAAERPSGTSALVSSSPEQSPAGVSRLVTSDRTSLAARTLPAMPRAGLLDRAVERWRRQADVSGRNQALVLTGEGGIGKSVLLGQLLDRIEAEDSRAVVLVPCGNVGSSATLTELSAVDAALGSAADERWGRGGLLQLVSALRAAHGSVTLLIDTLDLLLSEESVPALATLIAEALTLGDVVITCRTHELNDYLQAVPRLAGRLTTFAVPVLDANEIIDWARAYLRTGPGQDDHSNFVESLEGSISTSGSLRQVCALPVRLALACQIFAKEGHLPEDLSITGLFQAYWEVRVHRHAGRADKVGEVKENAALRLASRVITPSGRIALRIPKTGVGREHLVGLKALAGEGVVRELPVEWEFFHQTFAEFAHARWVLTHGVESAELDELVTRATSGRANLWPAISSLLLQISGYDEYRTVAGMLPMTSADATRTQVLGALQRREPAALTEVLSDLADRVDLRPVALAALGHAPDRHISVAFEGALDALNAHPVELGSAAVEALAQLVIRAATTAEQVRQALVDVSSLTKALSRKKRDGYLERLVKPFVIQPTTAEKRAVLRETYGFLGPLGRRDAIRAHLRHTTSDDEPVAIARTAIQRHCPPLDDDELVAILLRLWREPTERERLSWSSWREMLAAKLSQDWDNAQLKLVIHLAEDDQLAGELVDELLRDEAGESEQHVNAFAQVIADRPEWTANRLLSQEVPTTRRALNAVGKCGPIFATRLDRTIRIRLIEWLRPARVVNPRAVWPTQITLAADDLVMHRTLLSELAKAAPEPAVFTGVARSFFHHAPLPVLTALAEELRALVDRIRQFGKVTGAEALRIRGRLEGRLAQTDQHARDWIDEQVSAGASPAVAGTVAMTIADAHPSGLPASMVPWLCALLPTPHTDAAERLTTVLHDAVVLHADTQPHIVDGLITVVIDRMRAAVDRHEDSRLHRSLLGLLIRMDDVHPLDEHEVWDVYGVTRSRLLTTDGDGPGALPSDYSAALRDLSTLSGTLMSRRLDAGTVRDMVAEILTQFEPDRAGTKIKTALDSLLISIARRDPDAPDWLITLFGTPGIAIDIQLSIAEALLLLEGNMPGGYAAALKDRPGCPTQVANLIVTRLRD